MDCYHDPQRYARGSHGGSLTSSFCPRSGLKTTKLAAMSMWMKPLSSQMSPWAPRIEMLSYAKGTPFNLKQTSRKREKHVTRWGRNKQLVLNRQPHTDTGRGDQRSLVNYWFTSSPDRRPCMQPGSMQHYPAAGLLLGVLEQLGVQLLLDARPLPPDEHGRQADVSPVRVQHQTRVRRRHQFASVGKRGDEALGRRRTSGGNAGEFAGRRRTTRGRFTGHYEMFWCFCCMRDISHAVSERGRTTRDDFRFEEGTRLSKHFHFVTAPPSGSRSYDN